MVFYRSFYEAVKDLDPQIRAEIYDAIFKFGLDFQDSELNGMARAMWTLIKPQIEANNRRYLNGIQGGEHGSKGGRPTKDEPQENPKETPSEPLNNPKETPNVNANANANVNANKNVDVTKVSPEKDDNVIWVIAVLNKKAGTAFKANTKATQRLINARIKEGYTGKDFKAVITHKVKQWADDPAMSQYIRPSTLFGTKFESYLNAAKLAQDDKPREFHRPKDPTF